MKTAIRCALLAVFLGSLSALAAARTADDDVPKRTVHYADLNLASPSGAAVLYQRIRTAARAVCHPEYNSDLQQLARAQECAQQAIKRAIEAVNAPQLTSYYQARTKPAITVAQR